MSECKMCQERGQTWSGSAPKCSFATGVFNSEGWNCATANALRDLAELSGEDRFYYRAGDESIAVLSVPHLDGFELQFFIVMTWYKNRGRTGKIVKMLDSEPPELLTIEDAEYAIRALPRAGRD